MVGVEEYLSTAKEIMTMALAGVSDEEIADKLGMKKYMVSNIRSGLGLRSHKYGFDITNQPKKAKTYPNGAIGVQFTIPNVYIEDLGMKLGQKLEFTGKYDNKKLILTFRPTFE